ncbi:hypothetical protein MY4824_004819 [Beauveria thailandica]
MSHGPENLGHHATVDRSFSATYHAPLRPRRGLYDPAFSRDPTTRSFDEGQLVHERRVRSYRDTTSEIISLYASRNATTHSSAMARHEDDSSSRAPHSRYPVGQRLMQSNPTHLRNPSWQKSRTPGPYPARLRRPGTRINSPTMADARSREYSRMMDGERGPQRVAHNLYKISIANNQRRAPPMSLRAEMNKSSSSLPSRSSPGPSHYMTVSGRARTPSSTVSWASRPSDRYYMSSTDQSSRSASLTSIVEMYQRPMTSSSTCPALRPSGTLYYDYTEDFNDSGPEAARHPDMPLSPVPHRVGRGSKPAILQQDMELKMHGTIDVTSDSGPAHAACQRGYSQTVSSMEESFGSYLQGSHDDSIEEIERAIADAMSNAAADKLMAASEHANAYTEAFGTIMGENQTATNDTNIPRRLPATERQYGLKTAAPNMEMTNKARRASQLSLNKNVMALDPAFADFTSLLSSFERLAKSPFSRLSDEDDADEGRSRRSSKLSTMETLDEMEIAENPYPKRHHRNIAAAKTNTPAPSAEESLAEHSSSSGEDMLVLAPEPLSPHREKKGGNELHQKFMKALPPLPAETLSTHPAQAIQGSEPKQNKNDSAISQVRSLSLRSHVSRSGSPGKLKLRVRTPPSSGETEHAAAWNGVRRERRSTDDGRSTSTFKPPPKLKLKISRNQLGQGRTGQTGTVIRNNRLKQCNALADVAPPPRIDADKRAERANDAARISEGHELLAATVAQRNSAGGSCQPSDQFNLSYPPTPVESAKAMLPRTGSLRQSIEEMQRVQLDSGEALVRRVKPKFSFLRLRSANQAAPTTLSKPAPGHTCISSEPHMKFTKANLPSASTNQFDPTMNKNSAASVSIKSERMGNRVKRWATGAKRVFRSYVRRTLIRSPKSAKT